MSAPLPEIQAASDEDLDWFQRHPDRAHRVRLHIPGEGRQPAPALGPGFDPYVLVKQIVPGLLAHATIQSPLAPPCDCESCASNLWLHVASPGFRAMAVEQAALALRHGR